jgi:hypothetical protein
VTNLTGPAATNWSDYLYWDTTVTPNSWRVDGDKVHLGSNAGSTSQGAFSVAVGSQAGRNNQGNNSIAIGYQAGLTGQHASTIILNASGGTLNSGTQNACYIAPIRGPLVTSTLLYYDSTLKEVMYGAAPSSGSAISTFSTFYVSSLFTNTISTNSTLVVSSLGIGTSTPQVTLDIAGCVNINTLSTITNTFIAPGTYSVAVPPGATSFSFNMIGAGGNNSGGIGGIGGYIQGNVNLPPGTTSIDVSVGSIGSGGVGGSPSGSSYITILAGGPLFAIAGAGGSGPSGGNSYGGGGSFTLGVANGGGTCPNQGGSTTGGLGYTINFNPCDTLLPAGNGQNPGTSGPYQEAFGGSLGGFYAGGSGYAGGGVNPDSGGGGSSYINTTYTSVIVSYNGNLVPISVLPGYGRGNQSGYVSIVFPGNCNNTTSITTNGGINVSALLTTSSLMIGGSGPPAFPLEINQSGITSTFSGYVYNSTIGTSGTFTSGTINVRSVSGIWASNFYASSDQRIKANIKDINDDQALQVVRGLQPVCYNYIDPIRHHNQIEYGFIAQQVKPLLPHAVRTETDFVPNIYDLADFSALGSDATMVTLRHRTVEHIQVNDVVKILDLKEKPLIYSVTDVNYNYFTIDVNLSTIVSEYTLTEEDIKNDIKKNTVFVYGTRVDDFHVLDKHAIYSVSIGALQEMDRTIQRQALRILDLETRQEARLKELEDKLGVLTVEKQVSNPA